MGKFEEALEKLKIAVTGGRELLDKSRSLPEEYATEIVGPPLSNALEDVCLQIEDRHKISEAESEQNNRVIHYTSICALVSILQDASEGDKQSSLRLYDSVHFNDPDEGNYLSGNLLEKHVWLGKTDVRHAYISSFITPDSEEDVPEHDNLVYWRTYGREGAGCSLSLTVPHSRLQKVLYGPSGVKSAVAELLPILDLLDPLVGINNSSISENAKKQLAGVVWKSLERIRYLYKSQAYKYEHECRFVLLESDIGDKGKISIECQDQNSPMRLRHYYEHKDLQIRNLLKSGSWVTLGPCVPYCDNVRYCLETLKKKAGLYPEIKCSKITYRKS